MYRVEKGDEGSKEVAFPADFPNPVMAGKNVEFKIQVKEIKERVLPEIDDDFAKDVGEEFEDLAALREHLSKKIEKQKTEARIGDLTDQVMMKILRSMISKFPRS